MNKKEKVSITLDSEIINSLRLYAKRDDRNLSQYINRVLKMHLQKSENKEE